MIHRRYYSGLVWILSAVTLCIYATLGWWGISVWGVEELVSWLERATGWWLCGVAFIFILIEGTYLIGNFFPGATAVVILAMLSEMVGWILFVSTIGAVYVGWVVAGTINIYLAHHYKGHFLAQRQDVGTDVWWLTWFPSFRSSQEVAEVIAGKLPKSVFLNSMIVKVFASLSAAVYVMILSALVDIKQLSNEEGFVSIMVIAGVSLLLGLREIHLVKKAVNKEE